MRIRVTPVSASPARIAAGIGVAPRWRGRSDGWRFSAPWRGSSSAAGRSGRSRRAPARSGVERRARSRCASGVAQPRRASGRRIAELVGGRRGRASRSSSWRRPAGRGGAVTTPTRSIDRVRGQRAAGSAGRTRRCRGRPSGREPPARPSVTPGRSPPRGPQLVLVARRRPASARPSSRGSRCTACRRGGRARAAARGRAARTRRP